MSPKDLLTLGSLKVILSLKKIDEITNSFKRTKHWLLKYAQTWLNTKKNGIVNTYAHYADASLTYKLKQIYSTVPSRLT